MAVTYSATDPDGDDNALALSFDYSTTSGSSWTTIDSGQSNTGTYNWTVPNTPTSAGWLWIGAWGGAWLETDFADGSVTITGGGNDLIFADGFNSGHANAWD